MRVAAMALTYLADHPQWVSQLAALHHAEWAALMPGWSAAEALAELQSHRERLAIPTTLLALDRAGSGGLIGSVSLLVQDDPRLPPEYSPLLGSLYVLPAWRGRGHGAALVRQAVQAAACLGVPELYLFTAGQQDFYARLGWRETEQVTLGADCASIMMIDPGDGQAHAEIL